jgi:branched-chain amino acid transport system substrate-binding protein
VATFNQVVNQYDPNALQVDPEIATEAWATMTVFGAALKAGHSGNGKVTDADLLKGLHTFSNQTFGGLTPPLTYTQGPTANPPLCAYGAKVSNGQYVLLNGGNRRCSTLAEAEKIQSIQSGG